MAGRRVVNIVVSTAVAVLVWLAPAAPASAACPIDDPDCGGPTTQTYSSTLWVAATGGGSITSAPSAISCPSTCTVTDTAEGVGRPTSGWPVYTLSTGVPAGYTARWFACASTDGSSCSGPESQVCVVSSCQVANDAPGKRVRISMADETPPSTAVITAPTRVGPAVRHVTASASDGAGVVSYRWYVDGVDQGLYSPILGYDVQVASLAAGNHTLGVRARDAAGNESSILATKSVVVDKSVTLTVSSPPAVTTAPALTFSSADDDLTGIDCAIDDATYAPCTSPWIPTLADGSHAVHVRAADDVGNLTVSTRTTIVDTVAPALAFADGPTEGAVIAGDATSITVQQVEANPDTLACTVDGSPVACAPAAAVSLTGLAAGGHAFVVTATDRAGHTATLVRHFSVPAPAAAPAPAPGTAEPGGHAAPVPRVGLRGPSRVAAGSRARFRVTLTAPSGSRLVPAGLVTWTVDGKRTCRTTLREGRASCRTGRLAPGRHVVVVSYAGSADFAAATARKVVVVARR